MKPGYEVWPNNGLEVTRIDLVVTGGGRRLAVECDDERYLGPEKLQEDMERQSVLERLGWQFVRIRGSIFFQDEDRAMQRVWQRLGDLGISPDLQTSPAGSPILGDAVLLRVILRAQELRAVWRGEGRATDHEPVEPGSESTSAATNHKMKASIIAASAIKRPPHGNSSDS